MSLIIKNLVFMSPRKIGTRTVGVEVFAFVLEKISDGQGGQLEIIPRVPFTTVFRNLVSKAVVEGECLSHVGDIKAVVPLTGRGLEGITVEVAYIDPVLGEQRITKLLYVKAHHRYVCHQQREPVQGNRTVGGRIKGWGHVDEVLNDGAANVGCTAPNPPADIVVIRGATEEIMGQTDSRAGGFAYDLHWDGTSDISLEIRGVCPPLKVFTLRCANLPDPLVSTTRWSHETVPADQIGKTELDVVPSSQDFGYNYTHDQVSASTVSQSNRSQDREVHPQKTEDQIDKLSRVIKRVQNSAKTNFETRQVDVLHGSRLQGQAIDKDNAIIITKDAVNKLTEDELAFLVAHEVAHLEHCDATRVKNAVRTDIQQTRKQLEQIRAESELSSGKKPGFVAGLVGGVVRGVLEGTVVVLSAKATLLETSREIEMEADTRALRLMKEAGYDPKVAPDALKKLHHGHLPDLTLWENITTTHPEPKLRHKELTEAAQKIESGDKT